MNKCKAVKIHIFFILFCLLVPFAMFNNMLQGKTVEPRINIITLGVKEIPVSKKFYESMGFTSSSISNEHFVAFESGGVVLCLFPETMLAEDALAEPPIKGFRGVTLAHNVATKEEVVQVLDQAAASGAQIVKPAQDVFWGGFSGYFADPDGHLWEVAWNPHLPLRQDGTLQFPIE